MTHVFYRHTKMKPPKIKAGKGVYLIDENHKKYLDASSGAAVSCLGHSCENVHNAAKKQIEKIAYAHTSFFTSQPAEELADALIQKSNHDFDKVYFLSGGSEAIETALKIARQYYVEKNQAHKRKFFIARKHSYHGNTLGALATSGNVMRREMFSPILSDAMHHIEPCHYWRYAYDGENKQEYAHRTALLLEKKIQQLGPENVIAFIAETVVGATLGAVTATEQYFKYIREICNRYDILLILDEVMCGMGRTGTLFAYNQENIIPDMVCVAKGLGAGIQPIGATLVSKKIYKQFENGSGAFQHGHTYVGHPTPCATAYAVLKEFDAQNLLQNVTEKGKTLFKMLKNSFDNLPYIGDIRGRGLFIGIELVTDRKTKKPFEPNLKLHNVIKKIAMQNGLLIYPMGGTADGTAGDHILLAPPYIINTAQCGEIVEKLKKTFDEIPELKEIIK